MGCHACDHLQDWAIAGSDVCAALERGQSHWCARMKRQFTNDWAWEEYGTNVRPQVTSEVSAGTHAMRPEVPEDNLRLEECPIVSAPAAAATHRASDKRARTTSEREEPSDEARPRKATKEQLADRGKEQLQIPSKARKQGESIDVDSARA